MQVEAILQGFANASFLAMPAFVIAMNPEATISIFEIIGIIWNYLIPKMMTCKM